MATLVKNLSLNEMANTRNKFAVIAFDETYYWKEDIADKAGKIEGVYLVNLRMPTHLCELSVSYPAMFLSNFFHNTDQFNEDTLTELECENGGERLSYFSDLSIPHFIRYHKTGTEEEILEYEMGNPSYC